MCIRIIQYMPEDLSTSSFQNRSGTEYGKLMFPEELESYRIVDYIGADSPGFFTMLRLDPAFLYQPVSSWPHLDSYNDAKDKVKSLKVVNYGAERGVKLATDRLSSAKTEKRYRNDLQTVENDRNLCSDQRRTSSRE